MHTRWVTSIQGLRLMRGRINGSVSQFEKTLINQGAVHSIFPKWRVSNYIKEFMKSSSSCKDEYWCQPCVVLEERGISTDTVINIIFGIIATILTVLSILIAWSGLQSSRRSATLYINIGMHTASTWNYGITALCYVLMSVNLWPMLIMVLDTEDQDIEPGSIREGQIAYQMDSLESTWKGKARYGQWKISWNQQIIS